MPGSHAEGAKDARRSSSQEAHSPGGRGRQEINEQKNISDSGMFLKDYKTGKYSESVRTSSSEWMVRNDLSGKTALGLRPE